MLKLLKEAWRFRFVTENFVKTSLGNRYKRSFLGYLWSVLFPLLRYLLMGLIFGYVLKSRDPNYLPLFFTGMIVFSFMASCIANGTRVFINNGSYIKKIYVPKMTFVFNVIFLEFINFFLVLIALILLGMSTGFYTPSVSQLMIIPGIVIIIIFLSGVIPILGTIMVWFHDIQYFVDVIMQTLYFVTPILFPPERLPEFAYKYNPFYYFIEIIRKPLVYNVIPPLYFYFITIGIALFFLLFGLFVLEKKQDQIIFNL